MVRMGMMQFKIISETFIPIDKRFKAAENIKRKELKCNLNLYLMMIKYYKNHKKNTIYITLEKHEDLNENSYQRS